MHLQSAPDPCLVSPTRPGLPAAHALNTGITLVLPKSESEVTQVVSDSLRPHGL